MKYTLNFKLIGKQIKLFRKAKRITQYELGIMINKSEAIICKYERGLVEPPITVLIDIANILEIPPLSIIGLSLEEVGD
jgi:transcriptional regulator with XRE-family HTH domain